MHDDDEGYLEPGREYTVQDVLELAVKLHKAGKVTPAENIYLKVLEVEPNNFNALHLLGVAKQQKRQAEAGANLILKAIEVKPDFSEAYYSLSVLYKEEGEKEKAKEVAKNAIKYKPGHTEAHHVLSSLVKYESPDDPHIKNMEELIHDDSIDETYKLYLYFSLSKAYLDFGGNEKAFEYFAEANKRKRSTFEYDVQSDIDKFSNIKKIFSPEYFEKHKGVGFKNNSMIFILGMPRSGTSLVDQILSSHSQVEGVGELDTIKFIINAENYPENFIDKTDNDLEEIGYEFMQAVNTIGVQVPYVIDKMPDNFRLIGVLLLTLPNAKIIHCKRNRIDTCLSIYINHFNGIQNFAYDYNELGIYYKLYEDLMKHWKKVNPFPKNFIEVEYENMVEDTEGQTKRLLEFLGLSWEEQCLEFYKTKRSVKTASAAQVRQPIYKTSMNKWKKYEEFIKPLIDELDS